MAIKTIIQFIPTAETISCWSRCGAATAWPTVTWAASPALTMSPARSPTVPAASGSSTPITSTRAGAPWAASSARTNPMQIPPAAWSTLPPCAALCAARGERRMTIATLIMTAMLPPKVTMQQITMWAALLVRRKTAPATAGRWKNVSILARCSTAAPTTRVVCWPTGSATAVR